MDTHMLIDPKTDWRAKIGRGNTLGEFKTSGISLFPSPPERITQPESKGTEKKGTAPVSTADCPDRRPDC